MRNVLSDITLAMSYGDHCAVCSSLIKRRGKYVVVRLQLLHSGDDINLCVDCVVEAAIVADAAQLAVDTLNRREAIKRLTEDGDAA